MPLPAGLDWSFRFSALYFMIFLAAGIMLPWWPVFLSGRGLDAGQIGWVVALGFLIKPLAGPMITKRVDQLGERRRPLIVLMIATLAGYSLYLIEGGFWLVLAITSITAVFFAPVLPLIDGTTMSAATAKGLNYGRIRLWGSVSFIIAASGGGYLFEGRDTSLILYAVLAAFAVTVLASFRIPDFRPPAAKPERGTIRKLLTHPIFLLFMLATGLSNASHAVVYSFGTLNWQAEGLSDTLIGILWMTGVLAEIGVFTASTWFVGRFGPIGLLIMGALAGIIRWILTPLFPTFEALILLQLLHGLTYGAYHLGIMHFIQRAAPEGLSATAQGLYAAIAMGVVMGVSSWGAGQLYGTIQADAFFVMAAMSAVALVGVLVLGRIWNGERLTLP